MVESNHLTKFCRQLPRRSANARWQTAGVTIPSRQLERLVATPAASRFMKWWLVDGIEPLALWGRVYGAVASPDCPYWHQPCVLRGPSSPAKWPVLFSTSLTDLPRRLLKPTELPAGVFVPANMITSRIVKDQHNQTSLHYNRMRLRCQALFNRIWQKKTGAV